jgi:hypothetical protein
VFKEPGHLLFRINAESEWFERYVILRSHVRQSAPIHEDSELSP